MPGPGMPKVNDAAHDRVRLRPKERAGVHDRHHVRRHIQDIARNKKGPGASDAVRLPHVQVMSTAWTHCIALSRFDFRDQIAGMAAAEAELGGSHRCSSHDTRPVLSQISSGLKALPAATSTGIRQAKANIAVPVST